MHMSLKSLDRLHLDSMHQHLVSWLVGLPQLDTPFMSSWMLRLLAGFDLLLALSLDQIKISAFLTGVGTISLFLTTLTTARHYVFPYNIARPWH